MQELIYHVAITLDGFIAQPDGQVPGFTNNGSHVDAYRERLAQYASIVMGRGTYESGYLYGMKPGDKPYGERPHFIFSERLELPEADNLKVVRGDTLAAIDKIKAEASGDVYLCGGGKFAGHLLMAGRIDRLLLKISPLIYGDGIKLFEGVDGLTAFNHVNTTSYDTGVVLLEYARP
jgi:dihydrofolate reductase